MEEKLITIKEVELINNCPECYSTNGLKLTFKQKFIENKFYKSVTNEVVETLECTVCNTTIYPVSWTEDIERVYNYQKKAFTPKEVSYKLKRLSWVLISITLVVMILAAILTIFPDMFIV